MINLYNNVHLVALLTTPHSPLIIKFIKFIKFIIRKIFKNKFRVHYFITYNLEPRKVEKYIFKKIIMVLFILIIKQAENLSALDLEHTSSPTPSEVGSITSSRFHQKKSFVREQVLCVFIFHFLHLCKH
jgi:hypothetical protein